MKIVLCIERLTMGNFTFREGEAYLANMVNKNYWIVDSIGVSAEDFPMHFEIQEELAKKEDAKTSDEANKKFIAEEMEFRKFLENFGFDYKDENKDRFIWSSRLRDYILA